MDWKEKAIAAHRAEQAAKMVENTGKTNRIETLRANWRAELMRRIFGGSLIGVFGEASLLHDGDSIKVTDDGIKFKVVRDRSKPAEDVGSWDLYIGKGDRWQDDSGMFDWYGPITSLEQVGEVLVNNPVERTIPGIYQYQREPEDYGSETPPEPPKQTASDRLLGFIRGLEGAENGDLLLIGASLMEIADQLEVIAERV